MWVKHMRKIAKKWLMSLTMQSGVDEARKMTAMMG